MPPLRTRNPHAATSAPMTIENSSFSAARSAESSIISVLAALLISPPWIALPMARAPSAPKKAKQRARGMKRGPSPFLMVYIGPPNQTPPSPRSRKRRASVTSAYFVAMPSAALSQSQNNAPGPPRDIASATPAMFPVPTVPASAAQRACIGVMPSADCASLRKAPPRT